MRLLLAPLLFLLLVACDSDTTSAGPAVLPARDLQVQGTGKTAHVTAELASTPKQRQTGLMFRQQIAEDAGMLFLFPPGEQRGGFWMSNTYIPLTIAYVGADGLVQELRDGTPLSEEVLSPARPYRYVLEVNRGWFERHGLGVGARVLLPGDLPTGQ
jgi:hypothetical protein